MKKILKYTLIVGFMLLINLSADAQNHNTNNNKDGTKHNTQNNKDGTKHGTTTAPLDGGLLAILAIAGASYYFVRKKKKSTE